MTFTQQRRRAQSMADRLGCRVHVVKNRRPFGWSVNVSRPRGIGVKYFAVEPRQA